MHRALTLVVASVILLVAVPPTRADDVQFPLTVDYEVLRTALRAHLHDQPGQRLELWRSSDGCSSFVLREARVEPAGTRLKIAGPASGHAALSLFGLCWATVSWTGYAEITVRPDIEGDWRLRLRDPDIQLYDAAHRKVGGIARLFAVVKRWSENDLSTFRFDLGPPVSELSTLLNSFASRGVAPPLPSPLQTLRPVGLAVDTDALRVMVRVEVPAGGTLPRGPEPALTPAELKRWEAKLDEWDGFVSFVVKELAGANADPMVRDGLLALLLDARRQVVAILAQGPQPHTDATRHSFLATWDRLRTIVRRTGATGDLSRALRYVVFLAAGDALAAIDAAAPRAGLDFSADGLRRLARTLDPDFAGDPLEYAERPDPRLQELFRFRDPDAPPRRPRRQAAPTTWNWLLPRSAQAAEANEWADLAARLDRWVPVTEELQAYRSTVDRLLTVAAGRSVDAEALDERFESLFFSVVKATAWQESCWRQFARQGGSIAPLESLTGDVGLMQINVRVWRGFFSGTKLRWSAAYNAGAGAEILQQLLIRYGTREAGIRLDNAARATYSAYQGGPARYRRYRTATAASYGAAIDRAFWEKYQAVAAGRAADHVLCLQPRPTS